MTNLRLLLVESNFLVYINGHLNNFGNSLIGKVKSFEHEHEINGKSASRCLLQGARFNMPIRASNKGYPKIS